MLVTVGINTCRHSSNGSQKIWLTLTEEKRRTLKLEGEPSIRSRNENIWQIAWWLSQFEWTTHCSGNDKPFTLLHDMGWISTENLWFQNYYWCVKHTEYLHNCVGSWNNQLDITSKWFIFWALETKIFQRNNLLIVILKFQSSMPIISKECEGRVERSRDCTFFVVSVLLVWAYRCLAFTVLVFFVFCFLLFLPNLLFVNN